MEIIKSNQQKKQQQIFLASEELLSKRCADFLRGFLRFG